MKAEIMDRKARMEGIITTPPKKGNFTGEDKGGESRREENGAVVLSPSEQLAEAVMEHIRNAKIITQPLDESLKSRMMSCPEDFDTEEKAVGQIERAVFDFTDLVVYEACRLAYERLFDEIFDEQERVEFENDHMLWGYATI